MPIPTEDLISLSVTNFSTNIGVLPNQVINSSNNNSIDISGILSTGDLRYYPLNSNPSGYINNPPDIHSGYLPYNNGNSTVSWISPISPNWCILRDDFIGGNTSDGQVGELGWRRITVAGSATFNSIVPSDDGHHGIFSLTSPATLNQGGSILLGPTNTTQPIRNLNLPGWESYFIFKLLTTGIPMKLRIGFSDVIGAGGASEAGEGTWLRYDTVSPYVDTGYYFVSRYSSSNQQTSVGVQPDTNWHKLRMWTEDYANINFSFDNISGAIPNRNSSSAKFPVVNLMGGGGSTTPAVYLDYFGFMGYCGR